MSKRRGDAQTVQQQQPLPFPGLPLLTPDEMSYLNLQPLRKRSKLVTDMQSAFQQSSEVPLRFRVLQSRLPKKLEILTRIGSSEKYDSWVRQALDLPLEKFTSPSRSIRCDVSSWLSGVKSKMDQSLHGQQHAKTEILRSLCQWACSGGSSGIVLGLWGEAGIGKTRFGQTVLKEVVNRPFTSVPLGGLNDPNYLLGHNFTYEGACCGAIASALQKWKCMDGIFFFDELDKVGRSGKGDDVSNVLIHLTDPEMPFHDKFFSDVPLHLNRAFVVFSYNDPSSINPILLDRIHQIKFDTPTVEDKVCIARRHLLPRHLLSCSLEEVEMSDECIRHVIRAYTSEAGVRSLDRALRTLVHTALLEKHTSGEVDSRSATTVVVDAPFVDRTLTLPSDRKSDPCAHMYN